MFDPSLIFIGLAVGITIGLSGIGGAVLTAPILILLGIPPVHVVGSDIAFNAATKGLGSILHVKRQNIAHIQLRYLIFGSIPALILGSIIIKQLSQSIGWTHLNMTILTFIGVVLIGTSILNIINMKKNNSATQIKTRQKRQPLGALIGFIIGFLLLMTSIGAGSLLAPYLMKTVKSPRKVVGTSILYGLIISALATLFHLNLQTIKLDILVPLLFGSFPGVYIGVKFNDRIPLNALRSILSILILASGIFILLKFLIFT